ncbi:MAG: hypothetical protein DMF85_11435, partial [Acidobacteria bacterium]
MFIAALALMWTARPSAAQTPAAAAPPAQQTQAAADLRAELDRLRSEFETVRDSYGARLAALEAKLAALNQPAGPPPPEAAPVAQAPAGGTQVPVPSGAAGAGGPEGQLPVYGNVSALSKIFNPDMAVIGNFIGAAGRNTVAPMPALRLNEAEMSFQAIVDPYARADFFLAASPDGLEIEEGFITFPTLPGG